MIVIVSTTNEFAEDRKYSSSQIVSLYEWYSWRSLVTSVLCSGREVLVDKPQTEVPVFRFSRFSTVIWVQSVWSENGYFLSTHRIFTSAIAKFCSCIKPCAFSGSGIRIIWGGGVIFPPPGEKRKKKKKDLMEQSLALMLKQMAMMMGLQAPASQGRADREYLFCTCAW